MSVSLLVVESDKKGGHAELCPQQLLVCLACSTGHRMKIVKPPYLGKELRAGWAHVRTDAQVVTAQHTAAMCALLRTLSSENLNLFPVSTQILQRHPRK